MYKNCMKSEVNNAPSFLNTSPSNQGVVSQLAGQLEHKPSFDGVTIETMRNNPLYSHNDDIDKVGLAQKRVVDNAKAVCSKTKTIRKFNEIASKMNIPSKHSK